ncbi:MAG: LptF/LptG family permease [Geminicoccaceae bacterium]|nr:LptF/LptG family permease [Geminicoccaceae bacterium]
MSTLTRYLNRMLLARFLAALLGLWAFAMLFDLLDVADELLAHGGGALEVLRYAALRTPSLLGELLPMAAVLAALFLMADLLRHSELPVIWGAGVSPGGVMRRLWPACLLLLALKLGNDDLAVPRTIDALRAWGVGDFKSAGPGLDVGRLWLRQGDAVLRLPVAGPATGGSDGFLAFRLGGDGNLVERVVAARARLEGGSWHLEGVTRQGVGNGSPIGKEAAALWPNRVAADRLAVLARPPQELGLLDLADIIRHDGYGVAVVQSQRTAFWHRLFGAFVPTLLVLLAAALATRFRRRGMIGPLFMKGLGAGFFYIIASGIAVALAEAGFVAPIVGTGLPALVLLAAVVLLSRRARRLPA